jgi:Uncharacterised nucleotidyltransferase
VHGRVTGGGEADELAVVAQTLRVDAVTLRATSALTSAGIPSVLLKGRAFARELYDSPAERPFGDSDLLVPHADLERAGTVLARQLGYRRANPEEEDSDPSWMRHAQDWTPASGTGPRVELHWTLIGVGVAPAQLWHELAAYARPMQLGTGRVPALAGPATAWLASLHAAQHGGGEVRPMRDLARALAVFSQAEWEEAADLAARLDSTSSFSAGLRLTARGAELADVLGLDHGAPITVRLSAANAPAGSHAVGSFAGARGVSEALAVVRGTLIPPPVRLKRIDPLARRGALGLIAAYLRRPWLVARRLLPAWRAWREARAGSPGNGER